MGEQLVPCAKWQDDCQGKKDYDGRLISISTRYWPGPDGGSAMTFDSATGQIGEAPYGSKPSAKASILLNHGEPDQYGYGDYTDLAEAEFEGDTEADVKAKVEVWVLEQFNVIHKLIADHYRAQAEPQSNPEGRET